MVKKALCSCMMFIGRIGNISIRKTPLFVRKYS
jgi:hypothetical protein